MSKMVNPHITKVDRAGRTTIPPELRKEGQYLAWVRNPDGTWAVQAVDFSELKIFEGED